jgi:KUP system potassium uptake protein
MVGASALLADGVITPAITVTSSIEGLKLFNQGIPVVTIVLAIFTVLFFMQKYGTNVIGGSFGPIMLIWFSMLAVLGFSQLVHHPEVLKALNPYYAISFLIRYPSGFILLGAVFLATTGAEALYSDLGHCGIKNIRVSWIFVKASLLLNYFGQFAWVLGNKGNISGINPFYGIMPPWFLIPGIFISTAAAIIASQALITGSFTLISEAVSLNFWPRVKVSNPTLLKGQVYVPFVNWFLWIACSFVVIFFRESSNMEAAYGLSITITMIMTTMLLSHYFYQQRVSGKLIALLLIVYLSIEGSFLVANLHKFRYGGWFTLLLASLFFLVMYGWYFGRKLKNKYVTFAHLNNYMDLFKDLSEDGSVPLTATNLVYIIKANNINQVESKVIYSIFNKQPKRAKTYWFLHIDIKDEPYTFEYKITQLIPGILIRVDFSLGFKIDPTINLYFRQVIEDLDKSGEIDLESGYDSIRKHSVTADFLFILIDRVMGQDHNLTRKERIILSLHNVTKLLSIPGISALKLESSSTVEEKVPIVRTHPLQEKIKKLA